MRGTELTEAQIDSARDFLLMRQLNHASLPESMTDDRLVSIRFGDFARVVAWYGALRYQAASSGLGGTLEEPAPMRIRAENGDPSEQELQQTIEIGFCGARPWIECENCGGTGYSHHDCGDDTCCCADPEDNVTCEICRGNCGWIEGEQP